MDGTRRWFALAALGGLSSCAAEATPPPLLSEQDQRTVLEPSRLGWLSSEQETSTLPSAIALGARSSGRVLVYLEFPSPEPRGHLLRAELLLFPSAAWGNSVPIEVSRSDAAPNQLAGWSQQPRVLSPRLAAEVSPGVWPERVDVTELVRAHGRDRDALRLLLRAEPGDGEGVPIATGAAGGSTPRLEVYWR